MNAVAPGCAPSRSPAPAATTTRTLTMGRSWFSTNSTRTPFARVHVATSGGFHTTGGPPSGGFSRKAASGVVRGGDGGVDDGHDATGAGPGGGGGKGGWPPHAPSTPSNGTAASPQARRGWRAALTAPP